MTVVTDRVRPQRSDTDERRHRRERLAVTMRLFADRDFDEGVGGHVTARDPARPDHFWINPIGLHFGHVRASDLLLVGPDGEVVEGEGRINPAGFAIHSAVHEARPDVVAAAHTHSLHGRAWSTLGRPLAPITQDACAFYEDHAVHHDYSGVVLEEDEAAGIARSLGDAKAVILRNHGLLTVGGSVEEAAWWFVTMDRSCQVQLAAEAAGTPYEIDPTSARRTRDTIGTVGMAQLNFRPLHADIVRRHADVLD